MRTSSSVDIVALWKAAHKHDHARVKELVAELSEATHSLAFLNAVHPRKGTTPLLAACAKRETEHKHPDRSAAQTIALLLEFGADPTVRARDRDGDTALHAAAACNQVRSVELLLGAGVDPCALNARGHSALDVARWNRSADVVDVLTSLLRLHSGWLFVRTTKLRPGDASAKSVLRVWKRRYAVALASDNSPNRVVELAIFKDRDDTRPQRVILLKAESDALVAVPKTKWLDRHNMFCAAQPLLIQKTKARRFSRTAAASSSEPERLEFAAESAAQQAAWLAILRCQPSAHGNDQPLQAAPSLSMTMTVNASMLAPDAPYELFGTSMTTSSVSSSSLPLSPLGPVLTVSPAHIAAVHDVYESPRRRDEPSAPSFVSSIDDMRLSQLSFYEQVRPSALADDTSVPRRGECVICMDAPRDAICVPCGHVAGCYACLSRQQESRSGCPICRAPAVTVVRIYDC